MACSTPPQRLITLAESANTSPEREAIMSSVNHLIDEESRARRVEEGRDTGAETAEWLATHGRVASRSWRAHADGNSGCVFDANLDDVERFMRLRVSRGKRRG